MKDFIKTLESLIQLLVASPLWLQVLAGIWLVITLIVFPSFLIVYIKNADTNVVESEVKEAQASIPSAADRGSEKATIEKIEKSETIEMSFLEYLSKFDELKDRFLEKDEFIESMRGNVVNWEGYVTQVRKSYNDGIAVTLDVDEKMTGRRIFVHFTPSLKTKAYSLRSGDKIRFVGKIVGGPPTKLEMESNHLEFIREGENGPPA